MKRALYLVLLLLVTVPVAARIDIGESTRTRLKNGFEIVVVERHELPLVELLVVVKGGSAADPGAKTGLTSLTLECLRRGAGERDALELAATLDSLGADLSSSTRPDSARLALSLLARHTDTGLDVLADLILRPHFAPEEFEREKNQTLARIEQQKDQPSIVATRHFQSFLLRDHPYAHPPNGTASSVGRIRRDDLLAHHAAWFVPPNATLVVVGDVDPSALLKDIKARFSEWKRKAPPRRRLKKPAPPKGRRVLLLDKPDATQSQVRLGSMGIARTESGYDALFLANTVLGSGFTSRLVETLRVDMSLTYSVRSVIQERRVPGALYISTFTPTETTRRIIDVTLAELAKFRESGPSAGELAKAKGFRSGLLAIDLQSYRGVANAIADIEVFGLPENALATAIDRYRRISLSDARKAARRYPLDDLAIVVLGNAEAVKPQLEGLGPIEVVPYTTEP